jgi:ankyrin repeat protein
MLLHVGGQVNKTDAYFSTPLHAALTQNDESMANILLKAGASVNCYDCEGRTPVMLAMDSCNRRLFSDLVRRGSNLDVLDRQGWNVVIYAIERGMFSEVLHVLQKTGESAKTILRYGDPQGKNALHHAVCLSNIEAAARVVQPLVALDPQLAALGDCNGNTPVHYAAEMGRIDVLRTMTEELPSAEMENNRGETPLLFAAHRGYMDCVIALLHDTGKGAMCDAMATDCEGKTLLMCACESGHLDLVNLLVQNRDGKHTELAIPYFDVNTRMNDGTTALIVAAREGHWQLLPSLVLAGASATSKDLDGFSPLHWAAATDENLTVACLLDLGFDINGRDNNGWTPLMHAGDRGCIDAARLLVDYRADLDARNLDGDTALQIGLRCKGHVADTMHDILTDAVLDHNPWTTQAVPAQGHFMISVIGAEDLLLEGTQGDMNAYVCLQFKANADAIPQVAFTSCSIRNSSPDWHEGFRFDTNTLDPSAYMIAWVMAAPGNDAEEIVQSTALGLTDVQLRDLQEAGVDLSAYSKPTFETALDESLKRMKKRVDKFEDADIKRIQTLVAAQEAGGEPTENLKRSKNEGLNTLSQRRWQEAQNFLSILKKNGCDAKLPLALSTHIPVGCVLMRFRHLRQAIWSTEPVECWRMLRLASRGALALEVEFRPKYFCPVDPAPPLPQPQDESDFFVKWDTVTADEMQKAFPRREQKTKPSAFASEEGFQALVQGQTPATMLKRFFQVAIMARTVIERHKNMEEGPAKSKPGSEAAGAERLMQQAVSGVTKALRGRLEAYVEQRRIRRRAMDEPIPLPEERRTARGEGERDDVARGLLDEPWLQELVDGSRFV